MMDREIKIIEKNQKSFDYTTAINYLVWLGGVLLFIGTIAVGERALLNGIVVLGVLYLIKEK